MTKGAILSITIILGIASLSSCKRRHDCVCIHSGANDARYEREYRGYSRAEAIKLCKSEEQATNSTISISCELR